jgi:RNA polymerase sigma-70 factor (ECF subfamily)
VALTVTRSEPTRTAASDAELIELWAGGDERAGQLLLERYQPTIRRFFRNRTSEDLDDLIQQTFLCCVEARQRFRGDASFRTFILAIARNQLFRHYRTSARRRLLVELPAPPPVERPSEAIVRRQDEEALVSALRSVPPDMQLAVELAYWEDLDAPEIASRLEVPLGTVYSRLHRARELLRTKLNAIDGPMAVPRKRVA